MQSFLKNSLLSHANGSSIITRRASGLILFESPPSLFIASHMHARSNSGDTSKIQALSPMEAEDKTLALLQSNWFYRSIFSRSLRILPQPPKDKLLEITPTSLSLESSLATSLSGYRCSRCEEHILSPLTSIQSTKFQTICSVGESRARRIKRYRYRRESKRIKNWGSRSLSDLEFEELKGFMDLGFTFSNTEASDPWLMSIVPGLQRLRTANGSELTSADSSLASELSEEIAVTRPYLSEVWEVEWEREERSRVLRNWRTPVEGEGIDLKDHLRFWAHAVASSVL